MTRFLSTHLAKRRDTLGLESPLLRDVATARGNLCPCERTIEKRIDPTNARRSAPILSLSYLFVAVSLSLFCLLQPSTNTYPSIDPSNITYASSLLPSLLLLSFCFFLFLFLSHFSILCLCLSFSLSFFFFLFFYSPLYIGISINLQKIFY